MVVVLVNVFWLIVNLDFGIVLNLGLCVIIFVLGLFWINFGLKIVKGILLFVNNNGLFNWLWVYWGCCVWIVDK